MKNKSFFPKKNTHTLLSEDKRNKFPHRFLEIVMVSISLSDKNIKLLKNYQQKHLITSKTLEES